MLEFHEEKYIRDKFVMVVKQNPERPVYIPRILFLESDDPKNLSKLQKVKQITGYVNLILSGNIISKYLYELNSLYSKLKNENTDIRS